MTGYQTGYKPSPELMLIQFSDTATQWDNWLAPMRFGCTIWLVISKLISTVDILTISCEIALRWMPQDLTDDKSTLVQVTDCCLVALSHYLNQCWLVRQHIITEPMLVQFNVTNSTIWRHEATIIQIHQGAISFSNQRVSVTLHHTKFSICR